MLNLFTKKFKSVTVAQAKEMMKNKNTMIVDVREPYEYASGHIKGAKLIPLGSLPDQLQQLDENKDIILVCASGARSGRAASFLGKRGYRVHNLMGGMMGWSRGV
ncbi:rhodanese-like domain-containing protein [Vallitalea pronyensis]|uniref:Rhodanese-like domain-containing protein n=1 Tax=Vallitalea pronyensis TaxID=1348613 RepID=A0A8J8MN00_9FIRM|nr:rhodanese-like domain-containing protein [Vallitalea pronyensis]QUI24427.1 rhodanese-like domain-containing protein [Vallitalea pronyensis]